MSRGHLSGLQRDVLSLYRKCLREISRKPIEAQTNFRSFAREEFEKNMALDKKDFSSIEFLLRKGQRQFEVYSAPGITNMHR